MAFVQQLERREVHGQQVTCLATVLKGEPGFRGSRRRTGRRSNSCRAIDAADPEVDRRRRRHGHGPGHLPESSRRLKQLVADRAGLPMSRIDDAVRRILTVKVRMDSSSHLRRPDAAGAGRIARPPGRGESGRPQSWSCWPIETRCCRCRRPRPHRRRREGGRLHRHPVRPAGRLRGRAPQVPITPGTTFSNLSGVPPALHDQLLARGRGSKGASVAVVAIGEAPYAEGKGDPRTSARSG